jgi:hypothetical protein
MTTKYKLQSNNKTSLLFITQHNQFNEYFTATLIFKHDFTYYEHEHKLVKSIDDAIDWSSNFILNKHQCPPTITQYN